MINATPAAQRGYHRLGQGWPQHMGLIAVGAVRLALAARLSCSWDLLRFGVYQAYRLAASKFIIRVKPEFQRITLAMVEINVQNAANGFDSRLET